MHTHCICSATPASIGLAGAPPTFVKSTAFCITSAIGTAAGAPAVATAVAMTPATMTLEARAAEETAAFCSGERLSMRHERRVQTY